MADHVKQLHEKVAHGEQKLREDTERLRVVSGITTETEALIKYLDERHPDESESDVALDHHSAHALRELGVPALAQEVAKETLQAMLKTMMHLRKVRAQIHELLHGQHGDPTLPPNTHG